MNLAEWNVLFARRHCFVLLMLLLIKKYISTLISTLLSLCIADYYWLSRPTSSKSYIVKARSEVGRCSINRGGHLVFSCWSRSCPMLCLASNLIFLDIQNLVVGCFCGLNRLLILCPGGARPCVYSVAMPQPATDILPPMILWATSRASMYGFSFDLLIVCLACCIIGAGPH